MLGDGARGYAKQDQRAGLGLGRRDFWHHSARTLGQHLARPSLAPVPATGRNWERLIANYLTPNAAREAEAMRPAFAPLVHVRVPEANQPASNADSPEAMNARSRKRSVTAPLPL